MSVKQLKELMHEWGMTQAELANLCGVTQSTISKIFSGESGGDPVTIKKIAAVFKLRPITRDMHTLRGVIKLSNRCSERFDEAEALAKSIFTDERCVPLPGFFPDSAIPLVVPGNLDNLVDNPQGTRVLYKRIIKLYPQKDMVYLIKPKTVRYWLKSIALRDASEVFTDLVSSGY